MIILWISLEKGESFLSHNILMETMHLWTSLHKNKKMLSSNVKDYLLNSVIFFFVRDIW